ncbi:MAG: type II toxin-antitoxin system VapC family toxin [Chloroflexi bacterium]|nr:type II toxin-antitoxin system VapC family toxin [Chloroflexota bacterium]
MSDMAYVLDTSAILTLLEDEEGAGRIEELLRSSRVYLPFPVLLETYYVTLRQRNEKIADERYALLKQLPAEIIWDTDEPVVLTAATLKGRYSLSLADAIIAAFALRRNAILVHKDPEFEIIASQVRQEALPYKIRSS